MTACPARLCYSGGTSVLRFSRHAITQQVGAAAARGAGHTSQGMAVDLVNWAPGAVHVSCHGQPQGSHVSPAKSMCSSSAASPPSSSPAAAAAAAHMQSCWGMPAFPLQSSACGELVAQALGGFLSASQKESMCPHAVHHRKRACALMQCITEREHMPSCSDKHMRRAAGHSLVCSVQ